MKSLESINYDHCSISIKRNLSKIVRSHIDLSGSSYPIFIYPTNKSPVLLGESYHWENKSGDRIYYPSAYSRKYGNPIYIHSTLRIEVGLKWLEKRGIFITHPLCDKLNVDTPTEIVSDFLIDRAS